MDKDFKKIEDISVLFIDENQESEKTEIET
jgi:hypothetical protein